MLRQVHIKNFETWIDQLIKFHPGVNVLIGNSDQGKSGIIRALKWGCRNRPSGSEFRTDTLEDDQIFTEVKMFFSEKNIISRMRNNTSPIINKYVINNSTELVALKSDVPDEIQKITRIKDINIQGQHPSEQYFLLADKPGQVAKSFNKVAGLSIMDEAFSEINSLIKTSKSTLTLFQTERTETIKKLSELEWTQEADFLRKNIQKIFKLKEHSTNKYSKLSKILTNYSEINKKISSLDSVPTALIEIKNIQKSEEELKKKRLKVSNIQNLELARKNCIQKLYKLNPVSSALKELQLLENLKNTIQEKRTKLIKIQQDISKIKQITGKVMIAEKEYKKAFQNFNSVKITEICPTCGRTGK